MPVGSSTAASEKQQVLGMDDVGDISTPQLVGSVDGEGVEGDEGLRRSLGWVASQITSEAHEDVPWFAGPEDPNMIWAG